VGTLPGGRRSVSRAAGSGEFVEGSGHAAPWRGGFGSTRGRNVGYGLGHGADRGRDWRGARRLRRALISSESVPAMLRGGRVEPMGRVGGE
jgi:hypothetical protein